MRPIQKVIHAGFAMCALASASLPALSWTVWPDIDFEWYADVGRPLAQPSQLEATPAPREGFVWIPGRYAERADGRHDWIAGRWVNEAEAERIAAEAPRAIALNDARRHTMPTGPSTQQLAPGR